MDKPANLSRVIGMVLSGDLHNAAVLLAQSGMMKSFSGRCVARWLMGRLLRRSSWHLNQLIIPAALDAIDDARMVAGPAAQRWVAIRLASTQDKILRQCKRMMHAGNVQPLIETLEELGRRGLQNDAAALLLEQGRIALHSGFQARNEQWGIAISLLQGLRQQAPEIPWVGPRIKWLRDRQQTSGLNETRSSLLSETLVIADRVVPGRSGSATGSTHQPVRLPSFARTPNGSSVPKRLLLWIDGIGHWLICLEPEIWVGRYVPLSGIQVPLLADIGRRHLRLVRNESGEDFVRAHWPASLVTGELQRVDDDDVQVNRVKLSAHPQSMTALEPHTTLELGERVLLDYRRPEPGRPAIIRSVSGHRTVPAANAVVWITRTLTIGGGAENDIQCPNRNSRLKIEFGEDGVFVTGAESVSAPFAATADSPASNRAGIRVSSSDISLVLEPLESGQEIPFAGSLQPGMFKTNPVSGSCGGFRIE